MTGDISWYLLFPEIALLIMACAIMLADLGIRSRLRTATYVLTLATLALVAFVSGTFACRGVSLPAWGGLVVFDPMGNWLKCFAALTMMACLVYGRAYVGDRDMLQEGGEFFSLSMFALLGIMTMISANNMLVMYLGLELLTLSSYVLVALRRTDGRAIEAAMKYFVLGAMASGFLLYGISMLYGATGSLNLSIIADVIAQGAANKQVLVFALVFIVAGLAFKFGAVPFHMWVPDVYQGAPTAITLFIASAPKLAAFAMAIRLLVEGLLPLAADWQQMLALLAMASLLIGNLAAIAQTNIKRMLAYSTISHMGFVLLGLLAGVVEGRYGFDGLPQMQTAYGASMFYVVTYVLTTLVSFGVVILLARRGFEAEEISDYAGLNKRSPLYAAVMAVCMFSLAGIPPLVGFYAKLTILQALVGSGMTAYIALAVFAVVMSLIGAFYYLRVVKVMYFDEPCADMPAHAIVAPCETRALLLANTALLLVLGVLPGWLMALCADAIREMLSI